MKNKKNIVQTEKIIAIIPARGGSKRIPKKNIRSFLGTPIIKHSIDIALKAKIFDEIMVSTDDSEIAKLSASFGANIPFMRSKKNSDDIATLSSVLKEVLLEYAKNGKHFKYFCCIYPTAPLIDFRLLQKSIKILKNGNFDTVLPVVAYSHPIQRALRISKTGELEMINKKFENTRTQDLSKSFYDAGQFFFMKTESFLQKGKIFTNQVKAIELPQLHSQDIDNEDDWMNAEIKYQAIKAKNKKT